MKRVVVFPLPIVGHVTPMLHLATALASQGVPVTFVTTPRTSSTTLQRLSGEMMRDLIAKNKLTLVDIPDGPESEKDASGGEAVDQAMIAAMQVSSEFERALREIADQAPVACVISDFLMGWTQDACSTLGIPRVAFWTSSATFLLIMYNLSKLHADGCVPLKEDKLVPSIRGLPTLRASELPLAFHKDDPYDPGFQHPETSVRDQLSGAKGVIVHTFDELEQEAVEELRKITKGQFFTLGPLLNTSIKCPERSATLRWLDTRRPKSVLYASFGSLANLGSLEQLKELALGLEASQRSFILVIRSNLVQGLLKEFIEELQERARDRGLIVPWAPQFQVLEHQATGGFLTHSGWNSLLESIWTGVPMLGWPLMAEQNLNCKFIADIWKIGIALKRFDRDAISTAVVQLIDDSENLRANMNLMMKSSRNAATRNLQAMVGALQKPKP